MRKKKGCVPLEIPEAECLAQAAHFEVLDMRHLTRTKSPMGLVIEVVLGSANYRLCELRGDVNASHDNVHPHLVAEHLIRHGKWDEFMHLLSTENSIRDHVYLVETHVDYYFKAGGRAAWCDNMRLPTLKAVQLCRTLDNQDACRQALSELKGAGL